MQSMSHEMGHNVDRAFNKALGRSGGYFSNSDDWMDAIEADYKGKDYSSTGRWVSDYAHESKSFNEDFADSIKLYVIARKEFKDSFPHRAEVIERMLDML